MSAESKRHWRTRTGNAAAERLRDAKRDSKRGIGRSTEDGRLMEAVRDTLRHLRKKEQR